MGNPTPPDWTQGCYECMEFMGSDIHVGANIPDVGNCEGSLHEEVPGIWWGICRGDKNITLPIAYYPCSGPYWDIDGALVELTQGFWDYGAFFCGDIGFDGAGCLPVSGRTDFGCSVTVG